MTRPSKPNDGMSTMKLVCRSEKTRQAATHLRRTDELDSVAGHQARSPSFLDFHFGSSMNAGRASFVLYGQ